MTCLRQTEVSHKIMNLLDNIEKTVRLVLSPSSAGLNLKN